MSLTKAFDRETMIEHAEAVRFWLLGFELSRRTSGAIQRELGAIIAGETGTNRRGRHPLAGLTIADFIAELHSPYGGAVGRVKGISETALKELKTAIPAHTKSPAPAITYDSAIVALPQATVAPPQAAISLPQPVDATPPRPRGRPKGSSKAQPKSTSAPAGVTGSPRTPEAVPTSTTEIADTARTQRRRERSRRTAAPKVAQDAIGTPTRNGTTQAATGTTPTPAPKAQESQPAMQTTPADTALEQLKRLWPSLHPHARRALVLYTSTLVAEAAYER
jgi:hypothetical protein